MPISALKNRCLLRLTGADAKPFLQGILTIDALKLTPAAPRYGLLLTPQGKFLFDLFVLETADGILLEVDAARVAEVQKRLLMYRLRAKVEIAPAEHLYVFAGWDAPVPPGAFIDPRLAALGWRYYAPSAPQGEAGDYEAHRIHLAVPDAHDLIVDKSLPLEWGMDALGAVDFDKGCYVGQEVTARMRYRAQMRHYIHSIRAKSGVLPPPGTPVLQAEKEVGILYSVQENAGLARISLEAAKAGGLSAGGVNISVTIPSWATPSH